MKTEAELKREIDSWGDRCISFIEKGDRSEIRKTITPANRTRIDAGIGQPCPTCKRTMVKRDGAHQSATDVTAEHIIPRTLGGGNTADNLIAMCHECNHNRNRTMTNFFSDHVGMYGRQLSEKEKQQVRRFVEWCLRTVHTPESSRVDRDLTTLSVRLLVDSREKSEKNAAKKGSKKRRASRRREKPSIATATPESTAVLNDEILDVLKQILMTQQEILERLQTSLLTRFRRWLLSPWTHYQKIRARVSAEKRKTRRRQRSRTPLAVNKQVAPAAMKPDLVAVEPGGLEQRSTEEFIHVITEMLDGKGKISFVVLGNQLCDRLQEKGHADFSTKKFLNTYGFSSNQGLRNTILRVMPDRVNVTGEHPAHFIELIGTTQSAISRIPGLTAPQNGLRFPACPAITAKLFEWISENHSNYETWFDLREGMKDANISTRTSASHVETWIRTRLQLQRNDAPRGEMLQNPFAIFQDWRTHLVNVWVPSGPFRDVIPTDVLERYISEVGGALNASASAGSESNGSSASSTQLDGDGLYPLIEGFNSSSKGFRFPRNPIDLASTLLWFSDNFRDHPNTTELKDAMRENCNLSKTRINYLLNKISNIVFPTAPRITLADWSTAQPIDANSICSSLRDLVYSVFDENESKTVIKAKKQYFAEALSYLGEEE